MNFLRKIYEWVLLWATKPYAIPALFVLSFTESSFFPIPPDVLLLAMAVATPKRSFYFALVCSVGSVLGGVFGYYLGYGFMDLIGEKIVALYHFQEKWDTIATLYNEHGGWALATAGFTPLPYKVFTLAAGAFKINFKVFIVASLLSRSARFFLVGGLVYFFGPPVKEFIDKYFNMLSILFFVLLFLGFILIKYLL